MDTTDRDVERVTLELRLIGNVTWSGMTVGSVSLDGHSEDEAAEPIVLRRWTEDDVAQAEAGRLSGGWRSSDWPGLVVLSTALSEFGDASGEQWMDVAQEFTSVIVVSADGAPATFQCIDADARQARTPESLQEIAGYSKLIFHNGDPLDARHRLHFMQWFVGTLVRASIAKLETKEDRSLEDQQKLELIQCLFDEDSPLGAAPTFAMDSDPDALMSTGMTMPEIVLKPDGSLKLSFFEPSDMEGGSFGRTTKIYDETLRNQVGEEQTITPIPDREATALLASYEQKMADLKAAIEAEQEDNPS